MKNPEVTIIIPTLNRKHLLGETIRSILDQTYPYWRLIIIDDFSTDGTPDILEEFAQSDERISYFLKKEKYRKGPSGSRNCGLDIALERKAEFIHFFDDDDLMDHKKLELQIAPFLEDSGTQVTVSRYKRFITGKDSDPFVSEQLKTKDPALDFLFSKIKINSGGPIMRAELLKEERFNEDLSYGEERELFLKILFRYQPKIEIIDEILFHYRFHKDSLTQDPHLKNIKLGSIVRINKNLWDYLHHHEILSHKAVAFFLRQFLLENHNKEYVEKIYNFSFEKNELTRIENLKVRALIQLHKVYIKVLYKLLLIKF